MSAGNLENEMHEMVAGKSLATTVGDVRTMYRDEEGILMCRGQAVNTDLDAQENLYSPGCLYFFRGNATTTSHVYKNSSAGISASLFVALAT